MLSEEKQRRIVTQAFIYTGHDPPYGLIKYIDELEEAVLQMHRKMTNKSRSVGRHRVDEAMKEGMLLAKDRYTRVRYTQIGDI